ncbi:MAG: hypothetical protein H3C31_08565 [Brumimicrobium sp.]|nr:hypothetical protein [Brumimicrobium sp.]MCO5269514.1 hypothetical protein [Brumimicrobium sp.]
MSKFNQRLIILLLTGIAVFSMDTFLHLTGDGFLKYTGIFVIIFSLLTLLIHGIYKISKQSANKKR